MDALTADVAGCAGFTVTLGGGETARLTSSAVVRVIMDRPGR